jgi:hypothetical protein
MTYRWQIVEDTGNNERRDKVADQLEYHQTRVRSQSPKPSFEAQLDLTRVGPKANGEYNVRSIGR